MRTSASAAWAVRLAAALRAAGPLAFACRRSAATLLGLDGFGPGEEGWAEHPEVAVARGRHAAPGVHRHRGLLPGDVGVTDGFRHLRARPLLCELGTVAGPDLLERAVESALRCGLTSVDELADPATTARRPGARVLRQVLDRRPTGAAPTGSDAETRFLQVCRAGRLPTPVRQYRLVLGRTYLLDAAWVPVRVGAEVDGAAWHGPDRLAPDLRRQNAILLGRWLLLRFCWDDIVGHPDRVVAQLRTALSGAHWAV